MIIDYTSNTVTILREHKDFIKKARRVRKVLVAGMGQIGYYATGCSYALKNNIKRLVQDRIHAQMIWRGINKKEFVDYILP